MHHRTTTACVMAIMMFTLAGCYRYDKLGDVPMRTNRLTGKTQRLTPAGWVDAKPVQYRPARSRSLSHEELKKLTGKASLLSYSNTFSATIYNGNDFIVTGIVFRVGLNAANGTLLAAAKLYRAGEYDNLRPLSTGEITINNMDLRASEGARLFWTIDSAQTTY